MKNRRNYYRILQVQPDAPLEVIKASYRTLMGKLGQHPDMGGSPWSARVINEAYEVLSDPLKRAEYDRKILHKFSRSGGPGEGSGENSGEGAAEGQREGRFSQEVYCISCKAGYWAGPSTNWKCPACGKAFHQAEQRTSARTRRQESLLYYTPWSDQGYTGLIVDLSPDGMRFVTSEKIGLHTILRIKSPSLQATAKVVHCQKSRSKSSPGYAIGVQFTQAEFKKQKGTFFSTTV